MENEQARLIDLAYLAGLLDGEGWIGLGKQKPSRGRSVVGGYQLRPAVAIHVKSPELVEYLDQLARRNDLPSYVQHMGNGTSRWSVRGAKRVKRVLEAVSPFLFEKKKPAELVLEFIESRLSWEYGKGLKPRELEIHEDLRLLNGRK